MKKTILIALLLGAYFTSIKAQTRILDVPYITQQPHGSWCWAACTAMSATYYGTLTNLCEPVEWARNNITSPNRGTQNCCNIPTPALCEPAISGIFTNVFTAFGMTTTYLNRVLTFAEVQTEINNNRPFVIRIPGHVVVGIGYAGNDIHYIDPWDGYHIDDYTAGTTSNVIGAFPGQWIQTYQFSNAPCPIDIVQNRGEFDNVTADINATNSILISIPVQNNSDVLFRVGNTFSIEDGFSIDNTSEMTINITTANCP